MAGASFRATTHTHRVTAGAVMTRPVVSVDAGASLWDAWMVMSRHGIRHLVVLTDGHCAGLLDDRTLVSTWALGPLALHKRKVRELLTERTACVLPQSDVRHVAHIMSVDRVDAVPVVDEYG